MKNLVLTLIAVFCLIACEKEERQAEQFSWVGEWNATNIVINDTLQTIPIFQQGTILKYISITIPEGDSGEIEGKTFKNGMGFDFKLMMENQIEFEFYGGTKREEDKWGTAFSEIILDTKSFQVDAVNLSFYDINNKLIILFTKPQ